MKALIILSTLLFSAQSNAWYGPGGYPPWGWAGPAYNGYGYGYGMGYGMGYGIPQPSFNYTTTIIQQPIVQQPQPPVIIQEQKVIEREVCNAECERLRGYFRKH